MHMPLQCPSKQSAKDLTVAYNALRFHIEDDYVEERLKGVMRTCSSGGFDFTNCYSESEMTTSLEDAMEAASYIPERLRLLIGYGGGIEEMEWIAGSMGDLRFVAVVGDKSIEAEVSKRANEFREGDSQVALTISTTSSGGFALAIFGPASVERVAELLTRTANEITEEYVTGYLEKKQDQWKQPLATVLQFRPRPRYVQHITRVTMRRDLVLAMAECAERLSAGYEGHSEEVAALIDRCERVIETEKAGALGPWERSELDYARCRLIDGWLGLALTAAEKALAVSALPQAEYDYGLAYGKPQA